MYATSMHAAQLPGQYLFCWLLSHKATSCPGPVFEKDGVYFWPREVLGKSQLIRSSGPVFQDHLERICLLLGAICIQAHRAYSTILPTESKRSLGDMCIGNRVPSRAAAIARRASHRSRDTKASRTRPVHASGVRGTSVVLWSPVASCSVGAARGRQTAAGQFSAGQGHLFWASAAETAAYSTSVRTQSSNGLPLVRPSHALVALMEEAPSPVHHKMIPLREASC